MSEEQMVELVVAAADLDDVLQARSTNARNAGWSRRSSAGYLGRRTSPERGDQAGVSWRPACHLAG
jgi:hypothetical protein